MGQQPRGAAAGGGGAGKRRRGALLMIYVDTSALVPVFIREPKSEAIIGWLESSGERLAISEWSLVEFASAAAIKVRTGQAARNVVKQATARVHEFAQKHCTVAVHGRKELR